MKRTQIIVLLRGLIITTAFFSSSQSTIKAQNNNVTVYEYRQVPSNKIDEFIKRETTYWSLVAEKAIKDKTMTYWALLEKVGGYDLPNSSNYLLVSTYSDINKAPGILKNAESYTGVKNSDMEINSISTITNQFFLHEESWAQASGAIPEKDFNYFLLDYHNTNYADSLIGIENKYWLPFIKKAMDNRQTDMVAWGNAKLLSPLGENVKFTTVSYDVFKTLQETLMPRADPKLTFPSKDMATIIDLELGRREYIIYRVVKFVSAH
jgi:hypothetical protein